MASQAKDEEAEPVVPVPLRDLKRMLAALERIAQASELAAENERRKLAQVEDMSRRAARKVGPTTDEAEARVAAVMRRKGL